MSRLTDLIRQAKEKDPTLGRDLEAEFAALSSRRQFGLTFERHQPEAVELPGRPPRKGDKVRILPPRGSTASRDQRLWKVAGIVRVDGTHLARLHITDDDGNVLDSIDHAVEDVVVVAEFRDPIYPGLVSTGKVERGGDKPSHTVITAENFHALQTLQYTHRGKIDAIYIDPPYNTGAKDWKYNNDYVDGEDIYRHSKWLAFMERRLLVAKELLNPADSVLILAIDENELHRLGLLVAQIFPEAGIQLVTSVINRAGSPRPGRMTRVEEYLIFVYLGDAAAQPWTSNLLSDEEEDSEPEMPTVWFSAIRVGSRKALRSYYAETTLFYPVLIDAQTGAFHSVGEHLSSGQQMKDYQLPPGTVAIWPVSQGREQTWRFTRNKMAEFFEAGYARLGRRDPKTGQRSVTYLRPGTQAAIADGTFVVTGRSDEGAVQLSLGQNSYRAKPATTVWNRSSHYARDYGSKLLGRFLPGRDFPFPKSLFAVEDALRTVVAGKKEAIVLDFFAGSGTTAHALMRLNKQDGGCRTSISITNNEVGVDEQRRLRKVGLRPGDSDWETLGICDYVTKPRIKAAITGLTPNGEPIKGDYTFTDKFPMAEGFEENVEFFTLTYESPWRVARGRAFDVVAPLLWMRAGSEGRRIDEIPAVGWDVADVYGVIADLDQTGPFLEEVTCAEQVRVVFIVTDDDRAFQAVCAALPEQVEPVRLYESYLRNFEIKGRG